ncbi:cell wall-active antibiotics response protein LiaF [Paenibacillus sp. FSL W7-1287]|uniref:cell wall-active antibiotics response protein LiaF n=1 Tax=Paenibacillus sp. FSL W7-1287 TaxID=2954538 RepID=UPI0030FCE31D
MKRSFFDKYGVAVIIIAVGGWFITKQLGIVSFSLGKLILVLVGAAIIMHGLQMIRSSKKQDEKQQEQQWDYYNPNVAPPPPPPMDEPFSSVNVDQQAKAESKQSYTYGSSTASSHTGQSYSYGHEANTNKKSYTSDYDTINRSVFIGDIHYGKQHWELRPMNLSAFIGDMTIDLSKAHIPYGETRIQISAFIGDVKIFVPNDVTLGVSVQMSAFLGDTKLIDQKESGILRSSEMSTPQYHECERRILITVSTFIGDAKVKKVG